MEGRPAGLMRPGRAAVAALLALSLGHVASSCSQDEGPVGTPTSTSLAGPRPSLPFTNVSLVELARQTGLTFPAGTADFLTAQLQNRSQLDVTFTLPAAEVASFLSGSGLPEPVPGRRLVTHTSPLWKLNVDGALRGAARTVTTPEGVRLRVVVELVDEPGGRTRARMVVTPR